MSEDKPLSILRYRARNGTLATVDYLDDGHGGWTAKVVDVTAQRPCFAVDFGTLETGWACYESSTGWRWAVVPHTESVEAPRRPEGGAWRPAARLLVAGREIGGVRGLGGHAPVLVATILTLHDAYEAAPEAAAGMIPLCTVPHVEQVRGGGTVLFKPVFEVARWVERPACLGPRLVPPPSPPANPLRTVGAEHFCRGGVGA